MKGHTQDVFNSFFLLAPVKLDPWITNFWKQAVKSEFVLKRKDQIVFYLDFEKQIFDNISII